MLLSLQLFRPFGETDFFSNSWNKLPSSATLKSCTYHPNPSPRPAAADSLDRAPMTRRSQRRKHRRAASSDSGTSTQVYAIVCEQFDFYKYFMMSFIKIRNNGDPRTEPCGMPDRTRARHDHRLPGYTHWLLQDKYDSTHDNSELFSNMGLNFSKALWYDTQWNVFWK